MPTLWFMIVAVMVAAYVVLDGFDLGAGVIYLGAARTARRAPQNHARHRPGLGRQRSLAARRRRHSLLRLPAALRLQLQRLLSAADDGALAAHAARHRHRTARPHGESRLARILRRHLLRLQHPALPSSSARPSATSSAAFPSAPTNTSSSRSGPISASGPGGTNNGILDWYTVLTGVIALVTLTVHGSLIRRRQDRRRPEPSRPEPSPRQRGRCKCSLTVVGLVATISIRPGVLDNYKHHSIGFVIPVLVYGRLAVMMHGILQRRRAGAEKIAFVASALYIVGMLVGAAFALYPVVLPASTDPARNLTIYNTAAGAPRPERRPHLVDPRHDSLASATSLSCSACSKARCNWKAKATKARHGSHGSSRIKINQTPGVSV